MTETVKQEIARLRREIADIEWHGSDPYRVAMLERRIAYLLKEYVERGIVFEPDF